MKKNIKLIIVSVMVSFAMCVGEAGAIFLLINPGAGPAGSGEAQVAKVDDAYASYYNPAGLGFLKGSEIVMQHVNWLPNLADDIFYDFLAFRKHVPSLGTFGGHIIYLNLGEQTQTDELGNNKGLFKSYMMAFNLSYGTQVSSKSSIGVNFKLFHQKLAESSVVNESGDPYSTDFAFDIGYLTKFGKNNKTRFGLSVQNIGPPIDFIDSQQADPAPTNMKFGIYTELFNDGTNKLNFLFDANKLLVGTYPAMDWNGDGFLQDDGIERGYTDPWYKAIITCWLDDWYYKYDRDYDGDNYIGGHEQVFGEFKAFTKTGNVTSEYAGDPYNDELYGYQEGSPCGTSLNPYCNQNIPYNNGYNITTINYLDSADDFDDANNDGYWNPPEPFYENSDVWHELYDNAPTNLSDYQYIDCSLPGSNCANGTITDGHWIYYNTFETQGAIVRVDLNEDGETIDGVYYDNGVRDLDEGFIDWDGDVEHDPGEVWNQDLNGNGTFDTGYSATNDNGTKEVGSGEDYTFADELKELIANFGLEYWYTDSFVLRAGYIYDKEGKIMNPTFGAGIRFGQYGFDFGYTAGDQDHARANTMFFSVSMEL